MMQASPVVVKRNACCVPSASIVNVIERNLYKWIKIAYYLSKLKVTLVHPEKICLLLMTFFWFIILVPLKEGKKFAIIFCSAVFPEK